MEDKSPVRSAMVSRLPKFGGRSSNSGTGPLPNGSSQPTTPTQDGKTTSPVSHTNGVIRPSPFSLKWRRDDGTTPPSPTTPTSPADGGDDKTQAQLPSVAKEIKSPAPGTPKMRRSGALMVAVSSPKAIPKQTNKMSPKVGTKLAQSPLNGGPKLGHNASGISTRTVSESRLVRPRLGSSSPRSSSQDSLSQSSESLKTLAMDNIVRSNSFTHFKQIPSPTSQPMIRSFSFNRAVELAKPLANTQLRPPRSSFLKPPQLSNGRMGLGLGALNGTTGVVGDVTGGIGSRQYSRTPPISSSLPTPSISPAPSTPSALRKPLLPSCVLNKSLGNSGGSLSYRLGRPGQAKQQKSLFPGRVKGEVKASAPPECDGLSGIAIDIEPPQEDRKEGCHSDSDGSCGNAGGKPGNGALKQNIVPTAVETQEDMSLSSASSLDRGDTSEEFVDDLDSLGDVFSDGDQHDNRKTATTTQTRLHSFLSEALDWVTVDLEGHKEESPMQDSQGPLVLSPEQSDGCQASSLELSPSNSSGGTYMWDEEGLEPLGGHGTHACDSYDDSDLNSMDILNNLDHPTSGELDDDDLMLDVDLPEDGIHDIDRMSHMERSERARRQGQRRKHHRWTGPDHFHNDGRAGYFNHYDGLKSSRMSTPPFHSEGRHPGYASTVDELTLEHMTQDCTSLKNQLLKLKSLLQLEDTDSPADVPETEDSTNTPSQLEELIKEVQQLREELRSRDKTIVQLTLQCQQLQQQHLREQTLAQGRQVRCQCHHQRAPSTLRQNDRQMEKRTQQHYDKATQTYWRPPNHAGVLPAPLLSPWQAQHQGLTRTSMPQRRQKKKTSLIMEPQILHPSKPCLSERFHPGRLTKTPPTEGRSDLAERSAGGGACADAEGPLHSPTADVPAPANPDELSHLLSTHLHQRPGAGALHKVTAAAQREWGPHAASAESSTAPKPAASTCPRVLQPPRFHKRVSLPALKPGGASASLGAAANRTKQLPPPSRGLPCFNTGPQVQVPTLCRTSLLQPRRAAEPFKDRGLEEEPDQALLKDPGSAKILIPLSRSCLPKPKIP